MFDKNDFDQIPREQLLHYGSGRRYPGIYFVTYRQDAFRTPDGEECIRVTRAPNPKNDNGLRFWLYAELQNDWCRRLEYFAGYVSDSQFESISEAEFNQLVADQANELVAPLKLPLHEPTGFIGALMMYSMKTEFIVSLVAEYEDEFIHFYWDTTA